MVYLHILLLILPLLSLQEVNDIYEMFHTQCCLARKAYKHKTVHAIEMM